VVLKIFSKKNIKNALDDFGYRINREKFQRYTFSKKNAVFTKIMDLEKKVYLVYP
jgi:hypothetical protein